jgi:hypothetical protein
VSGEYPVSVNEEGIKIKAESMETEQIYHCIFENKVYLFYKDEAGLLNCYEIGDPETVSEIRKNPAALENILKKRAGL